MFANRKRSVVWPPATPGPAPHHFERHPGRRRNTLPASYDVGRSANDCRAVFRHGNAAFLQCTNGISLLTRRYPYYTLPNGKLH